MWIVAHLLDSNSLKIKNRSVEELAGNGTGERSAFLLLMWEVFMEDSSVKQWNGKCYAQIR